MLQFEKEKKIHITNYSKYFSRLRDLVIELKIASSMCLCTFFFSVYSKVIEVMDTIVQVRKFIINFAKCILKFNLFHSWLLKVHDCVYANNEVDERYGKSHKHEIIDLCAFWVTLILIAIV